MVSRSFLKTIRDGSVFPIVPRPLDATVCAEGRDTISRSPNGAPAPCFV
jgi:hypothetical protein